MNPSISVRSGALAAADRLRPMTRLQIIVDFVARSEDGRVPVRAGALPQEAERCAQISAAHSRLAVQAADEAPQVSQAVET